jgi:putative membrane protein
MEAIWTNVAGAAVFAGLGVLLFAVAFLVIDLLTPGKLWDEIGAKQNQAAATLIGCVAIALGIIVAAAIH